MNNPKVHLHKKMLTCITKKFTLETITIGDSLWICAHWLVWLVRFIQFNLHRKEQSYSWSTPAGPRESFSTASCLLLFPSPCQDSKLGNKTIHREKGIVVFMPINQASNRQSSSDFDTEQRLAARRENRTSGITVRWCPLTLLAWCSLLDSRLTLLHPAVVAAPSVAGVGSAGCVVKRQHDVRGA